MTDAEKRDRVIKGLSDALEGYEMDDYSENAGDYVAVPPVLIDYALALLKAQEPRTCSECRHYDATAFTDMDGRCRNSRSCHYCYGCDKSFGCNAWEGR